MDNICFRRYSGIVFVGGFSRGDVPSSGVGWAMNILDNKKFRNAITDFKERTDTFSLGVCNGCQVMSYLDLLDVNYHMKQNKSKKFESRWVSMEILENEINEKYLKSNF